MNFVVLPVVLKIIRHRILKLLIVGFTVIKVLSHYKKEIVQVVTVIVFLVYGPKCENHVLEEPYDIRCRSHRQHHNEAEHHVFGRAFWNHVAESHRRQSCLRIVHQLDGDETEGDFLVRDHVVLNKEGGIRVLLRVVLQDLVAVDEPDGTQEVHALEEHYHHLEDFETVVYSELNV